MGVTERRLREREARIELILDSASEVFAVRGLQEATMEEIAEKAELGKGTLYYYFPSKEAILCALVETTIEHHFNGIRQRVREASNPLGVAVGIIEGFVANYRKNSKLFRLFYMVLASQSGEVSQAVAAFSEGHRRWLAKLKEDVGKMLQTWGLSSKSFIGFVGTHVHGIILLAVSGRDVEELQAEALNALEELFQARSGREDEHGKGGDG